MLPPNEIPVKVLPFCVKLSSFALLTFCILKVSTYAARETLVTFEAGLTKLIVGALHLVTVYVSVSVPHAFVAVIVIVFNPSDKLTFWLIDPVAQESPLTTLPFLVT